MEVELQGIETVQEPNKGSSVNESEDEDKTFTIDEALSFMGFGRFQFEMYILTGTIFMADAMEIMLLSFLIPVLNKEWNLAAGEDGLLGSVVFVGMFAGAAFFGVVSDKCGRRFTYLMVLIWVGVVGLASAAAPTFFIFLLCRFLVGMGAAGTHVPYSLFMEYTPNKGRAAALIAVQSWWAVGSVVATALSWAIIPYSGWRLLLVVCAIPSLVIMLFYSRIPESPRYLSVKGRQKEVEEVLQRISKLNQKDLPPGRFVCASPSVDEKLGVRTLLQPNLRLRTLLLWTIWSCLTFSYYGISFITPRFFGDRDVYQVTFITTLSEIPGLIIPAFVLDRLGRKRTLVLGFVIGGLSMLSMLFVKEDVQIILVFIARLCISGVFACAYVYTTEVYPTAIRSTGFGSCSSVGRISSVLTSFMAEDMPIDTAMTIFGFSALLAAMASYRLPVETNGKDLSDFADETNVYSPLGASEDQ